MPVTLVNRLGQRNEFAEFKTVLSDAGNRILRPVDAESMARDLMESGGREFVEMVRALTTSLANAETELANANRRYERLVADLGRRGISLEEDVPPHPEPAETDAGVSEERSRREPKSIIDGIAEWEEWDRKFRSLLG